MSAHFLTRLPCLPRARQANSDSLTTERECGATCDKAGSPGASGSWRPPPNAPKVLGTASDALPAFAEHSSATACTRPRTPQCTAQPVAVEECEGAEAPVVPLTRLIAQSYASLLSHALTCNGGDVPSSAELEVVRALAAMVHDYAAPPQLPWLR